MKKTLKTAIVWGIIFFIVLSMGLWLLATEIAPWISGVVGLAIILSLVVGFSDKARRIADDIDSIAEEKVFGNIFTLLIIVSVFAIYAGVMWWYFWPWFDSQFPYTDQRLTLGGVLLVAAFSLLPTLYLVKVAGIPVDDSSIKKSRNVMVPVIIAVIGAMVLLNPNGEEFYSRDTGKGLVMVDSVTGEIHRDREPAECAKKSCYSPTTGNLLKPKEPVSRRSTGLNVPFLKKDERYFDLESGRALVMYDSVHDVIHPELDPKDCSEKSCYSEITGEKLVPLPSQEERDQVAEIDAYNRRRPCGKAQVVTIGKRWRRFYKVNGCAFSYGIRSPGRGLMRADGDPNRVKEIVWGNKDAPTFSAASYLEVRSVEGVFDFLLSRHPQ